MKQANKIHIDNDIYGIIAEILVGLMIVAGLVVAKTGGRLAEVPKLMLFIILVVLILCVEAFVLSIIQLKKKLSFNTKIGKNLKEKEIVLLKEELRQLSGQTIDIMIAQVPIILLVPLIWLFVNKIKTGESVAEIVLFGLFIAFVVFVILAGFCGFIKKKIHAKRMAKLKSIKLMGKLEQVYLVSYVRLNREAYYCLRISYIEDGEKKEFTTAPDCSKQFVAHLNKLEYIPLIKNKEEITMDRKEVVNVPPNNYATDIDFYNLEKFTTNKNKTNEANSTSAKPNNINKSEQVFDIVKYLLGIAFPLILILVGAFVLLKMRNNFNPSACVFPCVLIVSGLIAFTSYTIMAFRLINKKKCVNFGKKNVAESFKILRISQHERNLQNYNLYTIKYYYHDENNRLRHDKDRIMLVGAYKSDMTNLNRLPIKTYKKHAIIDFEELTSSLHRKRNVLE